MVRNREPAPERVERRMGLAGTMLRLSGLAAAVAVGIVAMGWTGPAAAAEVNIYSSRHYDSDQKLYEAFTKATGIEVNVIQGGESELIERIRAEGRNSPADVLITVDAGLLWRARQADILQPVKDAALEAAIPAQFRDPDGYWFGFASRARILVYAKDRVKPAELSSYEALAEPAWKGRVLVRSSNSLYNQSLVASLLAAHGPAETEKWARGLVANFARKPQGGDIDQIRAVEAGEGDVAISNTYYFARLLNSANPREEAEAQKLGVFFPNQAQAGTHTNISGAGIARNAPDKAEAVRFIEFLASPEAQRIFTDENFEYPVVASVAPHPSLAAWGSFKAQPVDARVYGENNAEALKIMDRAGWR
jgi:iron(III) transport system substrate-binding protein